MNHPSRGLAIIINNEKFYNPSQSRPGSKHDAKRLKETFSCMGFAREDIHIHDDLEAEQMVEVVEMEIHGFDHS